MKQLSRFVVVTRPEKESSAFIKSLEKLGVSVLSYPTITIAKNRLEKAFVQDLKNLSSYDWIVFTSKNGVIFFIKALAEKGIDLSLLKTKHIGAVGIKTAEEIVKYHLPVSLIPEKFTTSDLAEELQEISGKKILLPRSDIATPLLSIRLREKGAYVTDIPIYQTRFVIPKPSKLTALVQNNRILCLTFTSPSTVEGFVQSMQKVKDKNTILSLPVLSIGPVTTKKAVQEGFETIYTADIHTLEGMLTKFKESIL